MVNTEQLSERTIALPTGTTVGIDEIDTICGLLKLLVENGPELTRRLEKGTTVPSGGHA